MKTFDSWWDSSPYRIGYLLGAQGEEPPQEMLSLLKLAYEAGYKDKTDNSATPFTMPPHGPKNCNYCHINVAPNKCEKHYGCQECINLITEYPRI